MIRSIAVFCGSKSGKNPLFTQEAKELGAVLATSGIQVVYGAGNKGVMGAVANGVIENGGHITGIIPRFLVELEHKHHNLHIEIITEDMHDRKRIIYDRCDAAVILPGGYGTLDELFEMVTWNQLSLHDKKIFLLNTAGFYDALIQHIKRMDEEEFLYEKMEHRIVVLSSANEIRKYLEADQ